MFWGLMIHIITRVFKHLHSFTCSAKIMPTWTSTLNHLIAIIAFDSHFKSSSISLSLSLLHLKNISERCYSSALKLERIAMFHAGQSNIILPNVAQKIHGLALILFKSMLMQCDRKKSVIILFYLGSSLKIGAGTKPNEFARGSCFFSTKSNQIFYLDQTENLHQTLQILASSYF